MPSLDLNETGEENKQGDAFEMLNLFEKILEAK